MLCVGVSGCCCEAGCGVVWALRRRWLMLAGWLAGRLAAEARCLSSSLCPSLTDQLLVFLLPCRTRSRLLSWQHSTLLS